MTEANGIDRPSQAILRKENTNERKPFVLRGHHFMEFAKLVYFNRKDPNAPKTYAVFQTEQYTDGSLPKEASRDMIGDTPEDGIKQLHASEELYRRFLDMTDDHPVELAEGIKDEVCNTCPIIGAHCDLRDRSGLLPGLPKGDDVVARDGKWIDDFLLYQRTRLKSEPTIIEDTATFLDSPPVSVRKVRTDAQTVRTYFSLWRFAEETEEAE